MENFLNPDFLKFFIPLFCAVIAWATNEYMKQKSEQYLRKEKKYTELIKAIKGFYIFESYEKSREKKQIFLDQFEQCWLYCPDDVIIKGYKFLMAVHTSNIECSEEEKEEALGAFILSIRKDLYSFGFFRRTKLTEKDFKNLIAT